MTAGGDSDEIGARNPWTAAIERWQARLRGWLGPPCSYQLTRWMMFRLLGVVYGFAFLGLLFQGPALLSSYGLTPVASYVELLHRDGMGFLDVPSLFMWGASDAALQLWAIIGLVVSLALVAGYANMPSLLLLWFVYGSFERVGQLWFSFGWEIQILETTLIAACLAHPWDPRPLGLRRPPRVAIALARWLVFRIMLGAGLIKLRGDACWTELSCLDYHFETQPIPNPLSPLFHGLPHELLAGGVLFNHLVEVVLPIFVFGPRRLRLFAGSLMAAFQLTLIASGNLAFLNWLTLVPILACFDDAAILRVMPRRARAWVEAGLATRPPIRTHIWIARAFAVIVVLRSWPVVDNLFFAERQAMNRDFDRLSLVNTYGAFGSVGDERYEIEIQGTLSDDPNATHTEWKAYELPCKPGDITRRPCILGPYHRRLDWLIWFAAMHDRLRDPWLLHLAYKLLDGDTTIREQVIDPFGGSAPRWVRMQRFRYWMQPYRADTWWRRELVDPAWLQPISLQSDGLLELLARYRWPSRSAKGRSASR
jgi:hypothetical protein